MLGAGVLVNEDFPSCAGGADLPTYKRDEHQT